MKNKEVANRYAKALFAVADEVNKVEVILEEIRILANVLSDSDLQAYLASPVTKADEKKQVVEKLIGSASFAQETINFVKLISDKGRLNCFSEMLSEYEKIADDKNGVARGTVYSAKALEESERLEVSSQIEKLLNKKVIVEYKEDPSILGGIVAKIGDYTIDHSITKQLGRIKESLIEGVR